MFKPYYFSNLSKQLRNTLLPYKYVTMKIEHYNLYTHFILISQNPVLSFRKTITAELLMTLNKIPGREMS